MEYAPVEIDPGEFLVKVEGGMFEFCVFGHGLWFGGPRDGEGRGDWGQRSVLF